MGRVSFAAEFTDTEGPVLLSTKRPITRKDFLSFVTANPELRTELTAEGEMIVMPPAHSRSGRRNAHLTSQLAAWAERNGEGDAYDSSTGYDLPNGSNRSPDASWLRRSRLHALTKEQQDGYLPLCPDFVIELRSKSDSLRMLREKMTEYIANGAQLAWLIDPIERTVHIYRPGQPVEFLEDPPHVSGDPVLPGFLLDLAPVFAE